VIQKKFFGVAGLAALFLCSCFGPTSGIMNDDSVPAVSKGAAPAQTAIAPILEAVIEYPGPHVDWAGPESWLVHIKLTPEGKTELSMSPSVVGLNHKIPSASETQEKLSKLELALQKPVLKAKGCLSPVKVKLVRINGVVEEHQGCRGQLGWPRVASETLSLILESSI